MDSEAQACDRVSDFCRRIQCIYEDGRDPQVLDKSCSAS